MASFNGGVASSCSGNGPSNHAFSMPLLMADQTTSPDESEEWEYEYSETETETYYLTLDLTTPSIPCTRPAVLKTGRGGYKTTWINPGLGKHKRQLGHAPIMSLPTADSISTQTPEALSDSDDAGGNEIDDDREAQIPRKRVDTATKEAMTEQDLQDAVAAIGAKKVENTEEIQILELHSENPIIGYRGHTFSCTWAENIGTELLFTCRDPENPLPVLRALPDDVDLLAASSSRLISTSVTLMPKLVPDDLDVEDSVQEVHGRPKRKRRRGAEFTIPIGKDAREPRREQARFLERLVDVKRRKGEEDAVTINAQRRLYPAGWKVVMKKKREAERSQLQSIVEESGSLAEEAAQKLHEMEIEDKVRAEEERKMKEDLSSRKRPGRKAKDGNGEVPTDMMRGTVIQRRPRGYKNRGKPNHGQNVSRIPAVALAREQSRLSTPTPQRWDELELDGTINEVDDGYQSNAYLHNRYSGVGSDRK